MMRVSEFDFDPWSLDPLGGMWILLMSLVLLVIAAALSRARGLGLERDLAVAAVRGGVQIMAMGLLLFAAFQLRDVLLWTVVLAFVSVMVVVASYTSSQRARGLPEPARPVFWGISTGTLVTLCVMLGLQVLPTRPEFVIPIAGMVVGNSMNATSLAMNRLVGEVRDNRGLIEAKMLLGASAALALQPHVRQSVRGALIPTVDSLKTLGVVFIPGGMTGLLMGGVDPIWAAQYQLVIFFMILCSSTIATSVSSKLAMNQLSSGGVTIVGIPEQRE